MSRPTSLSIFESCNVLYLLKLTWGMPEDGDEATTSTTSDGPILPTSFEIVCERSAGPERPLSTLTFFLFTCRPRSSMKRSRVVFDPTKTPTSLRASFFDIFFFPTSASISLCFLQGLYKNYSGLRGSDFLFRTVKSTLDCEIDPSLSESDGFCSTKSIFFLLLRTRMLDLGLEDDMKIQE